METMDVGFFLRPQALRPQVDKLAKLKEKQTVRALGVSCHSLKALEAACKANR